MEPKGKSLTYGDAEYEHRKYDVLISHGKLIDELELQHKSEVQIPDSGVGVWEFNQRLLRAGVNAEANGSDVEEAIRKECRDLLNNYGMKG